jgi:hypothetical protein
MKYAKLGAAIMLTGCAFGLLGAPARAAVITYQLNTIIGGQINSGYGDQVTTGIGTVTYADDSTNANEVDVTIALTSGFKALEITMNADAKALGGTLTTGPGITASSNDVSAGGYKGSFDIAVPDNGNLGNSDTVTFTLALDGGSTNIDPSDFNLLDTLGLVYNAVHVTNCSTNAACDANGGSIWVGNGPVVASVPEPASIAVLGAGLLGISMLRRRTP